jgi:hypothetical protein
MQSWPTSGTDIRKLLCGLLIRKCRSTAFGSIPASGTFTDPRISELPNGVGTITVTDLNTKTKDVIVTVSWENPGSEGTQTVQLETYITQGGLGQ